MAYVIVASMLLFGELSKPKKYEKEKNNNDADLFHGG